MTVEIPQSVLLVLDVLATGGPMPPAEISKKTEMPLRTVSFALRKLRSLSLCRRIPNFADMRRPLYVVDADQARAVFMRYGWKPQ